MQAQTVNFAHARCLLEVLSKRDGAPNTRYYLSSLDPYEHSPAALLQLIRGHWSIENKNHYRRDYFYDEDRCQMRDKNAARILATMRSLAISLLCDTEHPNLPAQSEEIEHRPHKGIRMLMCAPSG